ncbi:3'-5' exonuclease [Helicobacter bizzozeronii]|uniref:3'-5' exonuclease n=1 Tax=Helicobacter bizzozeronii TaxID=56877 RepID=UPI000CEE1EBB|nr:3'-5' exonuclease [Helicobacter bizzozeronii]
MICVLDIESVPDVALIEEHYPQMCMGATNDLEICQKAFEWQKEQSGTAFLPLYLHKVISIASVIADDYGHFKKVGNFGKQLAQKSEKGLIADFLAFFNKHQPKLVTFNGRHFDLPLIMLKALAHNLDAHAFYEQENQARNKNKWENYRQRYSEAFHTDLLDSLTQFSGLKNLNLKGVCALCGLPGKYDVSGDQVHVLYHAGQLDQIDSYCQSDVLNTYWLYLKYELSKGHLLKEDYLNTLLHFQENLPPNQPYTPFFTKALQVEFDKELQA